MPYERRKAFQLCLRPRMVWASGRGLSDEAFLPGMLEGIADNREITLRGERGSVVCHLGRRHIRSYILVESVREFPLPEWLKLLDELEAALRPLPPEAGIVACFGAMEGAL